MQFPLHWFNPIGCLNWARIFYSLYLKSGYWMKPLRPFTEGKPGFYGCEHMLFWLTNATAMFQWLMETCLGDLHLKCCIIYLDGIIIFSKTCGNTSKDWEVCLRSWLLLASSWNPVSVSSLKLKLLTWDPIIFKDGIETDAKKIWTIKQLL